MEIITVIASELDKKYLRQLVLPNLSNDTSKNLAGVVVNKPWGNEYLMFKNDTMEVWHLSINHLQSTSLHCHPRKKTALIVLSGRALFSSLNDSRELGPLDGAVIEAGTFHATQAISAGGAKILEFETPPMKHDLIRLKDRYGRAASEYESADFMISDDKNFRLNHGAVDYGFEFRDNNFYLAHTHSSGWEDFKQEASDVMAVVLKGRVLVDNIQFHACDLVKFSKLHSLEILDNSLLLCVTAKR